jgi:radical SAM protein with 4Fe4S-binding SPASM domain
MEYRVETDSVAECKACEWRRLCEGGSAGHTFAEYGHMNAKAASHGLTVTRQLDLLG